MDKQTRRALFVTVLGICLYAALMNLPTVIMFLEEMLGLIRPVIAGSILALFIHVPMSGFKNGYINWFSDSKKKPAKKTITVLSFVSTILLVLLILALVLLLLIPELVTSCQRLYTQISERIIYLQNYDLDIDWLEDILSRFDFSNITQKISEYADLLLGNVVGALSTTIGTVVTACFAVIVSIYISLSKENLCRHGRKLVLAYLPKKWANRVLEFSRKFTESFSKFLSGQCTEAMILGLLMFFAFTVFQLPYASLVGVLTAVCAIIPYVGAFISSAVSVFLTLLIAPRLVLRCLIVYSCVQFVENQFIYPRVVGSSVGMPPLYTLIAAMIGGKLFGILGIIFFIPLVAVLIELVKEDAGARLEEMEIFSE